jgi:hypothetical protein
MKQTCNTVVTESGIFKFACINSFHVKTLLQSIPKSPAFSLLFVIYLYKICLSVQKSKITPSVLIYFQKVPGACLCLDSMHMIHLSIKWNTSCEDSRLTAGRSEITPFLLLYFQEVPGACFRMDSVYMIHLSTNWDTSCEGSA